MIEVSAEFSLHERPVDRGRYHRLVEDGGFAEHPARGGCDGNAAALGQRGRLPATGELLIGCATAWSVDRSVSRLGCRQIHVHLDQ